MGGVPGYQTFAHAYGVRMADHWDVIQEMVDDTLVSKALDNACRPHAQAQIKDLGITETEWIASEACKLAWRARHPATQAFWYGLQEAAINAVHEPGVLYHAGPVTCWSEKVKGHRWLVIKLPSGRHLTYFEPKVVAGDYGSSLTYMSMASDEGGTSRAWIRTFTHGGKLTGNCVQTLAGDLLKDSMPRIEHAGYQIVLSVHDELVCEAPDTDEYSSGALARLMATNPAWAPDLPLSAAGFEAYRYKKE
jgi:DNA polymerase